MKKLILFILLLNAVSGMAQSGWLNFAPGKYYGLWTTKWLQADSHFYWKGDTIHKELLLYADYKTDSVRFRPIGDPVWSPWYYAGHGGYVLPTASATVKGGIKVGTGLSIDSVTSVLSVFPDLYAPASGSANYVQVSPASAQAGNIWMDGNLTINGFTSIGNSLRVSSSTFGGNYGYIYFGDGTLDRWLGYDPVANKFQFQFGSGAKDIWHSGNSNLSTVDWAANNITAAGLIQSATAKFTTGAAANTIFTGDATGLASWIAKSSINLSSFNNDLGNYGGFLTSYTETDPTVYSWAKASTKPTYTYSEVGAEQAFSKNTAFNKNFGTTTGTVLEGRTFGTAANSATTDFAPASHTLQSHSNVSMPTLATNDIPKWNGTVWINVPIPSAGATNLDYTESATNGIVTSDTGDDATIPLVGASYAGLMSPTQSSNLSSAYSNMGKIYDGSGYLLLNTSHFYMGAGYIGLQMGSISSGNADPVSGGDVYDGLAAKAALAGSLSQAFNAASLTIEAGTYDWAITNSGGALNFGQYSTNIAFSSAGVSAPGVNLSGETASTLASFDASKNIKSLSTATYPSLTEVSYVKGVSSAIQTQLNAKVSGSGTSGRVAYWNGTGSISSDADLTFDGTNLVVGGNITGAEVYRGSSRTLKKNIHIYRGRAMDILNRTPIYTYNLKSNNSFGIGFIAEETDKWLSGEDRKAHLMGNHLGIITKALQEKDDEIQELKSRVERLEKIVNQIKRRK